MTGIIDAPLRDTAKGRHLRDGRISRICEKQFSRRRLCRSGQPTNEQFRSKDSRCDAEAQNILALAMPKMFALEIGVGYPRPKLLRPHFGQIWDQLFGRKLPPIRLGICHLLVDGRNPAVCPNNAVGPGIRPIPCFGEVKRWFMIWQQKEQP
jgi:hypothetical protein